MAFFLVRQLAHGTAGFIGPGFFRPCRPRIPIVLRQSAMNAASVRTAEIGLRRESNIKIVEFGVKLPANCVESRGALTLLCRIGR